MDLAGLREAGDVEGERRRETGDGGTGWIA